LIIQDELHLISGPLGTIAGLYEAAIDALCSREVDGKTVRPKIVASTATVRRADAQVKALFGRDSVDIFPPPGPDRRDSFFALTMPKAKRNARRYVGIAASGRSLKRVMLVTYLAPMGGAKRFYEEAGGGRWGRKVAAFLRSVNSTCVVYLKPCRSCIAQRALKEFR
jgi:hypothetical protein